jgi:HK97 family phage prohead protease
MTLHGVYHAHGHRTGTIADQLGVIEAAEHRRKGLWVKIRFRQTEAALAVMRDIADGTLRGLSIGYAVDKYEHTQAGGVRIRTVTKSTVFEGSVTPVPADAGAHFRTRNL